jgi:serine/threonine protein kinase
MLDSRSGFPQNLIGKPFIDGWKIVRIIGDGFTSVVFYATRGSEEAAIKVYRPDFVPESKKDQELARIRRQLQLVGHDCPYLVRIIAGDEHPRMGYLYLVMGFVKGKPLDRVADDVPIHRIKPLLAQIACAARYLDEHYGIVHRDIKPTNIVVDDDFKCATLLDLGVIRPIFERTDTTSPAGGFLGTMRYSPPEVVAEEDVPEEAFKALTFYQLGGVGHDLITGRRLFGYLREEDTRARVMKTIREDIPDLSSHVREHVPRELIELVRKCLEKKWQDRLELTWEAFERPLFVQRPVVVLLYTGGTIGAVADHDDARLRNLRIVRSADDDLLRKLKRRVTVDYQQLAGPEITMPFDLEWDFLPPDQQMLSENARYLTWGNLGAAIERICARYARPQKPDPDGTGDYLAGIVVLHGTDTLAYSAAALSLSLRNLPCPVVLTGSNQPPNEKDIRENRLITSESDAWKNIHRSLQFIETFGHRFTEVFVCFSDTVHVAVNLRKSAIDRSPQQLQGGRDMLEEPYFYRNRGPVRQYAYKNIDGLYCNNLYPLSDLLTYDLVVEDRKNKYRHVRQSPWCPDQEVSRAPLAGGVRLLVMSPLSLLPGNGNWIAAVMRRIGSWLQPRNGDDSGETKVLLLEGYGSGTFPSDPSHPFHSELKTLLRKAVPVVLVSRNGLVPSRHQYEMQRIAGVELPVLRLFGLIAETATPLLSLILGGIPKKEWSPALKRKRDLLKHRHQLLRRDINRLLESGGILSAILGDILDEEGQRHARLHDVEQRDRVHKELVQTLFTDAIAKIRRDQHAAEEKRKEEEKRGGERRKKRFRPQMTRLGRPHFLWLLAQVVYAFERANAGPDGLAFLNQLGFDWGTEVRVALLPALRKSDTLFARRSHAEQDVLIDRAHEQAKELTHYLFNNGVAHALTPKLAITRPTEANGHSDGGVLLDVKIVKHAHGGRSDEVFAAMGQRSAEAEFFRILRNGGELTMDAGECMAFVDGAFHKLFEQPFERKLSPLDWFLLGTYKAQVCGLLRDLRFDPWVERCDHAPEPVAVDVLRQSICTEVLAATDQTFHLKLTYTGRRSQD